MGRVRYIKLYVASFSHLTRDLTLPDNPFGTFNTTPPHLFYPYITGGLLSVSYQRIQEISTP